jgi:uncharacterized protein YraI
MTRNHEKLLIAALCGMVICSAAAVAVQPAAAAGYHVESQARVSGVEDWDRLNIRKWPAPYSQKVGSLAPDVHVWVERCVVAEQGSDWCLVERGSKRGWVNSRYLKFTYGSDI